MSASRSELIGKNVYDQEAKLVGVVQDIIIKFGEKDIALLVRTPLGGSMEIPADKVLAARDIILLKEAVELPQQPLMQTPSLPGAPPSIPPLTEPKTPSQGGLKIPIPFKREEKKICPYCGKPATYIEQYKRWYCYNCQRYID